MEQARCPLVLLLSARPVQNFSPSGYGPGPEREKDMPLLIYNSDRSGGRMRRTTQRWTLPRSYVEVTCGESYRSGLLWEPSLVPGWGRDVDTTWLAAASEKNDETASGKSGI